jgi:hypothetical protein
MAVVLGLSVLTARAADDEDDDTEAKPAPASHGIGFHWSPVFSHMFGLDQPKPPPKPAPKPKKKEEPTAKKSTAPPSKPANLVDEAAADRAREEEVLLRRLAVCDKLMEIAVRTKDQELLHRAEQLDERARTTYAQRTAYLGSSASAAPAASPAVPPRPDSPEYTVSGTGHSSRAPVMEEKP